jgi:hypothetical protein
MKNGRSSELGGLVPELVKCEGEYLNRYLLQLINGYLEKRRYQSNENNLVTLYKKRSRKIPGNYRSVSIVLSVNCLSGLFTINCGKPQSTLLAKIEMVSD